MTIPASARMFWDRYAASAGVPVADRYYDTFCFGDRQSLADELVALVLAGQKRGTAGLYWAFEADGRSLPYPGALSVVTDWAGAPRCVVETTAVDVVPYDQVSAEFAAIEGEGDLSLEFWREAHWDYFGRECARIGRLPAEDMPVVCHRFALRYPAPGQHAQT